MSEKQYKCPLCDTIVDHFKVNVMEEAIYKVWNHGDGSLEWRYMGWKPESQQDYDILCPECGEKINEANTELEVSEAIMIHVIEEPEEE
ncbi:MAG: hypothetical protein ACOC6N_00490 [archaeon]